MYKVDRLNEKRNKKNRTLRLTTMSSLQGQAFALVYNLLYRLSEPFSAKCTNNALRECVGLSVSAGTVGVSDINGSHLRNLTKQHKPWMGRCNCGLGITFHLAQAVLSAGWREVE